jgi:hypothetical protein
MGSGVNREDRNASGLDLFPQRKKKRQRTMAGIYEHQRKPLRTRETSTRT